MNNRFRVLISGVVVILSAACSAGGGSDADSAAAGAVFQQHPVESELAAELPAAPESLSTVAASVLNAFLAASREDSPSAGDLDSLTDCGDGGGAAYFPALMLATWSLEPFQMRGDTVIARALVTTVAEQDVDRRSGGFTARQRIRSDLLEWDVYQTDEGRWVVCNGMRFGYAGADSLTVWRPDSTSYLTARALADSLISADRTRMR